MTKIKIKLKKIKNNLKGKINFQIYKLKNSLIK